MPRLPVQDIPVGVRDLVVVHTGPRWDSTTWPAVLWEDLLAKLHKQGLKAWRVGFNTEWKFSALDADTNGKMNAAQIAGLMQHARCGIFLDGYPLQIAQAVGLPAVAIFGATSPLAVVHDRSLDGPRRPKVKVLQATSACAPCYRPMEPRAICQNNRRNMCMHEITVDRVLAAVSEVIRPCV